MPARSEFRIPYADGVEGIRTANAFRWKLGPSAIARRLDGAKCERVREILGACAPRGVILGPCNPAPVRT